MIYFFKVWVRWVRVKGININKIFKKFKNILMTQQICKLVAQFSSNSKT